MRPIKFSQLFSTSAAALVLFTNEASAEFLECPTAPASAPAIDSWRREAATALSNRAQSESTVRNRLQQCFPTQIPSCLQRTVDYLGRRDVASEGLDETPNDMEQKRPPVEFLAPDAAGQQYVVPENIEQIAEERGWPAVKYKSRHAGGFDTDTSSLLMILVPGDKVVPPVSYDRWINIALPADNVEHELNPSPQKPVPNALDYASELTGGISLPRTFTLVTQERARGLGQPAKVFFQKFSRSETGSAKFAPESNSEVIGCYSCHPNGLRAISPQGYHVRPGEMQLSERDWLTVKVINSAMDAGTGNAMVSWREAVIDSGTGASKPYLRPKAWGPIVGAMRPLNEIGRTQEFIMGGTLPDGTVTRGCFNRRSTVSVRDIFGRQPGRDNVYKLSESPSIRWEKVRDSMRCAACHNNSTRAAFNSVTDFSQIDFKILVDQSMPLGAHRNPLDQGAPDMPVFDDLTGDERIALSNCLSEEFELEQKQLGKWLTQGVCQ